MERISCKRETGKKLEALQYAEKVWASGGEDPSQILTGKQSHKTCKGKEGKWGRTTVLELKEGKMETKRGLDPNWGKGGSSVVN